MPARFTGLFAPGELTLVSAATPSNEAAIGAAASVAASLRSGSAQETPSSNAKDQLVDFAHGTSLAPQASERTGCR